MTIATARMTTIRLLHHVAGLAKPVRRQLVFTCGEEDAHGWKKLLEDKRMKRLAIGLVLLAVAGCSETTTPTEFKNVQVSFATQSAPAPAVVASVAGAPRVALADTMVTGSDTLIVTSAQIVLREIELQRSDLTDCDGDDCEEFEAGPVLVDLPLTPGVEPQFDVDIPAGTYSQIEFDIHKVEDDPSDIVFLRSHPEFDGLSIRVLGTWNGRSFLFESELGVQQELDLNPPLTIEQGGNGTNITVFVEIDSWFRDLAGNVIDPDTANKDGDNESLVNENIKESFEAFEDDDEDGEP